MLKKSSPLKKQEEDPVLNPSLSVGFQIYSDEELKRKKEEEERLKEEKRLKEEEEERKKLAEFNAGAEQRNVSDETITIDGESINILETKDAFSEESLAPETITHDKIRPITHTDVAMEEGVYTEQFNSIYGHLGFTATEATVLDWIFGEIG